MLRVLYRGGIHLKIGCDIPTLLLLLEQSSNWNESDPILLNKYPDFSAGHLLPRAIVSHSAAVAVLSPPPLRPEIHTPSSLSTTRRCWNKTTNRNDQRGSLSSLPRVVISYANYLQSWAAAFREVVYFLLYGHGSSTRQQRGIWWNVGIQLRMDS